ncbi:hypothetical protein EO238_35130, partial [Citrobacter sp. AAK_AS5]
MSPIVVPSRLKLFGLVILILFLCFPYGGAAYSPHMASVVRISQIYSGGGNASSPYGCDFVELFNSSSVAV